MCDAIRVFCKASPSIVTLEDKTGMGALEYAIVNKLDLDIIQLVMRRSKVQLVREAESERKAAGTAMSVEEKIQSAAKVA